MDGAVADPSHFPAQKVALYELLLRQLQVGLTILGSEINLILLILAPSFSRCLNKEPVGNGWKIGHVIFSCSRQDDGFEAEVQALTSQLHLHANNKVEKASLAQRAASLLRIRFFLTNVF